MREQLGGSLLPTEAKSQQWVLDMQLNARNSSHQCLSYSGEGQPVSPHGTVNSSHSKLSLKNILTL